MIRFPSDHPQRLALADEAHARPPQPMQSPTRASYLAVLVDAEERAREQAHVERLCARFGAAPPAAGAIQFSAELGPLRLKWERHGEFSGYTFVAPGLAERPFGAPPVALLPPEWLQAIPGRTIVAAQAELVGAGEGAPELAAIAERFDGHVVVGAGIGEGAGWAFTDFRIGADGCSRWLLLDRSLTPRQAGRMVQRLFEIEAYRMLALLALPIAREQAPRSVADERALAELTAGIAAEGGHEEALLHDLTRLAAGVESGLAASQFRFGATRAYAELVRTRIAELRESRIPGIQTVEEFMARRFAPAVATCATVSQRLHELSERIAQASALLATRVGIARERQNQALLASMDRRAMLQLRLQQTVEGLSLAAIAYYVASLVGDAAKGAKAAGFGIDPELAVGLSLPVIALAAWFVLRRARRHLAG